MPMTEKEAKELTLQLWGYLYEHPEVDRKDNTPFKEQIGQLHNQCPLCELFYKGESSSENSRNMASARRSYCPQCPLSQADELCWRSDFNHRGLALHQSAYEMWSDAGHPAERKFSAKKILEVVSAWEPKE